MSQAITSGIRGREDGEDGVDMGAVLAASRVGVGPFRLASSG